MLLSARFLTDVGGVNSFEYANGPEWYAGDTTAVYLQLVDISLDRNDQGFHPAGRRYVPGVGSTLEVTFDSINDAQKVVRFATQPYSNDLSIWTVPVLATDPMRGTVRLKLRLADGVKIYQSRDVPDLIARVR